MNQLEFAYKNFKRVSRTVPQWPHWTKLGGLNLAACDPLQFRLRHPPPGRVAASLSMSCANARTGPLRNIRRVWIGEGYADDRQEKRPRLLAALDLSTSRESTKWWPGRETTPTRGFSILYPAHPHLLYPQFKHVAHPSISTSAFVLHLWHMVADGGKLAPSPVISMSSG
jgi:hypothetical protein